MGSVTKVFKKVTKAVTKPVSKAFKGVAKGIMKVGKATMRGLAKINKKLGPLGSIALAVAMPYALGGLSAGTTAAMNSQNVFLKAIGTVGNQIRTGYQAFNTGMSNAFNTISKSITQGFQKFAPKGEGNFFSKITKGVQNLYTSAKNKVKQYTPKFKTSKAGTVEVYDAVDPGVSVMKSTDAASALQRGTIDASQLGKQTLTEKGGFFTKVNKAGVKSDNVVTEAINDAYAKRLDGFGSNAKQMFKDVRQRASDLGTYVNDAEIGSYVENNIAAKQQTVADLEYFGDMDYYGTPTGNYSVKTEISDLGATGDYIDNGQGGYRFTGDKTFSAEPVKEASSNLMKAVKKTAFKFGEGLLKSDDEKIQPALYAASDMTMQTGSTGYGGTNIVGSLGGDFIRKVYGENAANNTANYYKNMNILV